MSRLVRSTRNLLQTFEYRRCTGPGLGQRLPAPIQHLPQIVREPRPLQSRWSFTIDDLSHDDAVGKGLERGLATENFVDYHTQGVAVGLLRQSSAFGTVQLEELRTHPLHRAPRHGRV